MRVLLAFDDLTAYQDIATDVVATPAVESGVGAVKFGIPARLPDGRYVAAHQFLDVDVDWIAAYVGDTRMTIEIRQE